MPVRGRASTQHGTWHPGSLEAFEGTRRGGGGCHEMVVCRVLCR